MGRRDSAIGAQCQTSDRCAAFACRRTQFKLHDFVIMPDHLHLLLTVHDDMTIEKAMQLIKGRFSHRLSHEFGYKGEVWQRGFTEVQVMNARALKGISDISRRTR